MISANWHFLHANMKGQDNLIIIGIVISWQCVCSCIHGMMVLCLVSSCVTTVFDEIWVLSEPKAHHSSCGILWLTFWHQDYRIMLPYVIFFFMLMFQTQPLILAKQAWYWAKSPALIPPKPLHLYKINSDFLKSCVVLFILPNKFLSHFCLQRMTLWQNLMDNRMWME